MAVLKHWFVYTAISLAACLPATVQGQGASESELKAVVLWRLGDFVSWPTNAFAHANSPLIIGVLGANPFGDALQEAVRDKTVQGRALVLQYYRRPEEIGRCHLLFISASEDDDLGRILTGLQDRPLLTVGDMRRFAERGGMVYLVLAQNRIKLRINWGAAKAAGLTISSRLLQMSELVSSR